MLRGRIVLALATVSAVLLLFNAAYAQGTVTADLASTAAMVGAGEAAKINVTVTCPKKHEVLEAFVYITQDGHTSQFSAIPIRKCKDKPITYSVQVRAFEDTPFHQGGASASSYVLVYTADGSTISGGEFQSITRSTR
ncbi:MAG: hypothetical protein LC799_01445 [Actinobacteria bacterium]|nr:hypothetical protein [Actinomycetota bacterium]